MRKQLILTGCLALFFLSSCNKTNNENNEAQADSTEQMSTEVSGDVAEEVAQPIQPNNTGVSPIQRQEKLIEGAQNQPLTNIAISESHFDFKDVKQGETVSHRFEITNTGSKPLVISAVKPACGCTVPEYTKDPVLPGQKGFVTLTFNSANFQGIQRKAAEIYANVEHLPVVLTFSANVITGETQQL